MKYLKWILCLLVIVGVVWPNPSDASSRRRRFLLAVIAAKNAGGEACTTAVYCETFDTKNGGGDQLCYAGEGSTCDNTWDDVEATAATNFQAADLEGDGTYSLDLDSDFGDRLVEDGPYNIDTATYFYWQVQFDVLNLSSDVNLLIGIQASSPHLYAKINGSEQPVVGCGGSSDTDTGTTLTTGQTYHMWLEYVEGSGDGSCALYVSTTATKPVSPNAEVTGITETENVGSHRIYSHNSLIEFRIDRIIVDDSPIGSNP